MENSKDMQMMQMIGINYLTEKEASNRYGYSKSWFEKKRLEHKGPRYIRLNFNSRILYPVDETDNWFKSRMMARE